MALLLSFEPVSLSLTDLSIVYHLSIHLYHCVIRLPIRTKSQCSGNVAMWMIYVSLNASLNWSLDAQEPPKQRAQAE